jgi:hypothetical protein
MTKRPLRLTVFIGSSGWLACALAGQATAGQAAAGGAEAAFSQEWGQVVSLDGTWEIAEGTAARKPEVFPGRVEVPGLVTTAEPAFEAVGEEGGPREAFWYRRTFKLEGGVPPIARLKIGKAMFGATVYLNGHDVGASALSFVPIWLRVEKFLLGGGAENELVVRVGAHIASLPGTVVTGADAERRRYPPGLYDRVQLVLSGDPWVARVQIAPRRQASAIEAAIDFAAGAPAPQGLEVRIRVTEWDTGREVATAVAASGPVAAGGETRATVQVPLPNARSWSPASPALYVFEASDGRHRYATRFGMREFKLDPGFTNRALLNGEPCFIRGTTFGVHRFFEDADCRRLPWDEAWVRRLFRRFTAIGMNSARILLGPAPERWYEIADEEGVMLFDEYALWYAYQPDVGDVSEQAADPWRKWAVWPKRLTAAQLVREYTAWMQERWNHPSVVVWDAQNETWSPHIGEAIDAVRGLDLSDRPWDNGWSPPRAPGDMRDAHVYFERWAEGTEMGTTDEAGAAPFTLDRLATTERVPSTFYRPYQQAYGLPADWHWDQPCLINEYSYLWLNRDGSPTLLTRPFYDAVLGREATADQRRELYARYLAAVTEYWRAARTCFGVVHAFGLSGSIPGGFTADNFVDVAHLQWDRHFEKYVSDAFAPVGVCAELWTTEFKLRPWWGVQAEFCVAVINDTAAALDGRFEVAVLEGESVVSSRSFRYEAAPWQVARRWVRIDLPDQPGTYEIATRVTGSDGKPVCSRRRITLRE